MDNKNHVLQGLIDKANKRIEEIKSGAKPALTQMQMQNITLKL